MVNGGIYVLKTVADCPFMSSTITILDTDEEVIDLDTSQDAITASDACNDDQSITIISLEDHSQTTETGDDSLVVEEKVEVDEKSSYSESGENEDTPKPLFKVMFRDESVSRKYRDQIKEFFEKLVLVKPQQGCNNVCSELVLEIWGEDICNNENINSVTESDDRSEVMCENPFFTMSKDPSSKKIDIPTYEKKYHKTVDETGIIEAENPPKENCTPKKTCFNCTGDHNLKDCPKPRNPTNINKNRKEFNLKTNSKAVRYHLDEDQKFGHMIPGQLSKNLRKALGIKENELPKHIYRMRTLGYPPGWLEEARLQHSGLSLFNSDGRREVEPNEEPGVIATQTDKDQYDIKKIYDFPGFNIPAPPGTHDDFKQYWVPHVQAPHSKSAMLLLLSGKKADDGYKRKKLKLSGTATPVNSNCELSEMEVVDVDESVVETVPVTGHFVPPLPKDSPIRPPPPQTPLQSPAQSAARSPAQTATQTAAQSSTQPAVQASVQSAAQPAVQSSTQPAAQASAQPSAQPSTQHPPAQLPPHSQAPTTVQAPSEDSDCQSQELQSPDSAYQTVQDGSITPSSRTNSPSLFDLESMKKQILVELEDSSSQSNPDSASKVVPAATTSKPDMPPPAANTTLELNNSLNTSDTESTGRGTIKSLDFGTPILQSTSPYSKLPPSEKFSKNICDVINFENLPDSTGKYEQMTGVIQKVRNVLAKIHKE